MGKKKLVRFAENLTFPHLIQPVMRYPPSDHPIKGKWKKEFFRNDNPIILELGCGRGEYTVNLAAWFPEKNFTGVDWKGARLWRGAKTVQESGMKNAGFLRIQIQNIASFFDREEVDEIWITFPDPQMPGSSERKRLTSPGFLKTYSTFLKRGGIIHLKTDSRKLYEYTLGVIKEHHHNLLQKTDDLYSTSWVDEVLSIKTTYEKMWLKDGLPICYIRFSLHQKTG